LLLLHDAGLPHHGERRLQAEPRGVLGRHLGRHAAQRFRALANDIEERHAATTSIMPDNITATLSIADLRDLVTFLTGAAD
jgi:hypothetical protein